MNDFTYMIELLIYVISSIDRRTHYIPLEYETTYDDILENLNLIDLLWSRLVHHTGTTRKKYLKKQRYMYYKLSKCLEITQIILAWMNKIIMAIENDKDYRVNSIIQYRPKWKI